MICSLNRGGRDRKTDRGRGQRVPLPLWTNQHSTLRPVLLWPAVLGREVGIGCFLHQLTFVSERMQWNAIVRKRGERRKPSLVVAKDRERERERERGGLSHGIVSGFRIVFLPLFLFLSISLSLSPSISHATRSPPRRQNDCCCAVHVQTPALPPPFLPSFPPPTVQSRFQN